VCFPCSPPSSPFFHIPFSFVVVCFPISPLFSAARITNNSKISKFSSFSPAKISNNLPKVVGVVVVVG